MGMAIQCLGEGVARRIVGCDRARQPGDAPQSARRSGLRHAVRYRFGSFFCRSFSEALTWAEMAGRAQPDHAPSIALVAASDALVDNRSATGGAIVRLRQLMPGLRASVLKDFVPIRRPEHFSLWADGLRKAGLPE